MKNWLLILVPASLFFFSNHVFATKRDVSNAVTLAAQYTLSADGDTLNFTASIVVTAAFSVTKSVVFMGNGYSISVPKPALNDAGVRNTSPSAYRVFTLSGAKTMVFNNLTIKGGIVASLGGAVSIPTGTTAKFNFCTISNAENAAGGGGIYNAGNCYLYKSFVTRNIGSFGGGIYNNAGKLFMEYSTVTENRTSTTNGGGGIENHSSGYLYINNSSFSNNQCGGGAGAINNYGGYAFLINSSFTGNISLAYPGGAIYQDNQSAAGRDLTAVNCLFAYNYYTTGGYTASSYTINDINVVAGVANLYYCTYMTNTTLTAAGNPSAGVLNYAIGNNAHALAGNGSTNDLFTAGSLTGVMNGNGLIQGTGKVFQPLLVNVNGQRVPTLKSGSYALAKGCNTRFTNGGGVPVTAYKNMSTLAWTDILPASSAGQEILNDQTNLVRAATPAPGAIEKTVDNYIVLTIKYAANGTVNGGSVYGEVYPSGTPVTVTAIPNTGYAFTNWTKDSSSAVTASTETGNPFTISPTVNTNLTPNFTSTTNFGVTYLGNGNTSGTPPAIGSFIAGNTITAALNTGSLAKTNFTFDGWNTADNGSGTDYIPGVSTYLGTSGSNLILFAKWGSTGVNLALPVHLVSFTATSINSGKAVQLHWQSATEINSAYYEVQRSADGQTWQTIQKINSTGNTSLAQNYTYTDGQPLAAVSYYRLAMVDKDGSTNYSAVRKLQVANAGSTISIYPNPASNTLFVTAAAIKSTDIVIYNASGTDVTRNCKIRSINTSQLRIDMVPLPQGLYFLKIGGTSNSFIIANK